MAMNRLRVIRVPFEEIGGNCRRLPGRRSRCAVAAWLNRVGPVAILHISERVGAAAVAEIAQRLGGLRLIARHQDDAPPRALRSADLGRRRSAAPPGSAPTGDARWPAWRQRFSVARGMSVSDIPMPTGGPRWLRRGALASAGALRPFAWAFAAHRGDGAAKAPDAPFAGGVGAGDADPGRVPERHAFALHAVANRIAAALPVGDAVKLAVGGRVIAADGSAIAPAGGGQPLCDVVVDLPPARGFSARSLAPKRACAPRARGALLVTSDAGPHPAGAARADGSRSGRLREAPVRVPLSSGSGGGASGMGAGVCGIARAPGADVPRRPVRPAAGGA